MIVGASLLPTERLARAFQQAPDFTQRELLKWGETTGAFLTDETTSITPKDKGLLQQSIQPYVEPVGRFGVSAVVGTSLNYAVPVEVGSKPHDIVPKNGKVLAFMMRGVPVFAKKVHHPGTKGYFMFTRAFEANINQITDSFVRTVDNILAMIAAGAR